ncbi:MAG: hypothetical protein FJX78_07755 [Armatimonadetes bacterium]|nr:hypothetical protein [Armatimonadota bacterium]
MPREEETLLEYAKLTGAPVTPEDVKALTPDTLTLFTRIRAMWEIDVDGFEMATTFDRED